MTHDFEPLNKPLETVSGDKYEWWYVETKYDEQRCLLNACFVYSVKGCANPIEELYYDSESEAYACMEEYYDRHNEPFPYRTEMCQAEMHDGIRSAEEDDDRVGQLLMDFI